MHAKTGEDFRDRLKHRVEGQTISACLNFVVSTNAQVLRIEQMMQSRIA
jgi:hypothetical protein